MSLPRAEEPREAEAPAGDDGPCGGAPRAPPAWFPSHVQVAVLGARGLRSRGAPAGDAYAVLQLGRQKLRTAVATDRAGCPRWEAEPCALEMPPAEPGEPGEADGAALLLRATVWQRALVGMDRFLGAAALPLGALLHAGRAHHQRWYKLHSKPGKKEKDRGEIQLSLQFTRHSLTASMFDLSAKEKPRSPFGKLKDKMKGRQKYDLESASAIVPSSFGAMEDDLGGTKKGPKLSKGGFFFKSKLRKSSLTQSNTSLGSDSTLSSASSLGGIAGPETLAPSPSRHSSLSTDRSVRDFLPSPKLTHKRAFSDEVSQISLLPESKSVQSLKPSEKEPISHSSLCINGSHIYCEEPSPKPSFLSSAPAPFPPPLPPQSLPHKPDEGSSIMPQATDSELPPWPSSRGQKGPPKDPPRFIPSPPILAAQEEDKLSVKTIALNKQRGRAKKEEALRAESKPVQIAAPLVFSSEVVRVRPQERTPKVEAEEEQDKKKAKSGFFRRQSSSKDSGTSHTAATVAAVAESVSPLASPTLLACSGGEERGRSGSGSSWFGRQDSKEQKPSSHPGLLADAAARELPREPPCFPEDHGPPPFGEPPPESAPQGTCTPELPPAPPTATSLPPSEWDERFDAFATSRLRPDASMEFSVAQPHSLDRTDPSESGAGPLLQEEGGPQDTRGGESHPGGPDLLDFVPEERRQPVGSQGTGELAESRSSDATLPWGLSREEGSDPLNLARSRESIESWVRGEETQEELEGGLVSPGRAEWWETPMPAEAPVQAPESNVGNQHAVPSAPSPSSPPSTMDVSGEVRRLPVGLTDEGQPMEPEVVSFLAHRSSEAPSVKMQETPVADIRRRDLEREEEAPFPQAEVTLGEAELPEEEEEKEEEEAEEEEEGEGEVAKGSQELQEGGVCECRRAEAPPPKPPRRFTPLNLQEEADEAAAVWGRQEKWQDKVAPCDEALALEAEQPRTPVGEAGPPLAAALLLEPKVIIGAGGTGVPCATESLRLAAEPEGANESRGRAVSSGDAMLAATEGAGGAEQFETCPSVLSVGGLSLSGAKEDASYLGEGGGGQPSSSVGTTEAAEPSGLTELGSLKVMKERPWQREGAGQPSRTLSPSVFFWSALEEQRVPPSQDRSLPAPTEGRGLLKREEGESEEGENEGPLAVGPSEEGPADSDVSQALPATASDPEALSDGLASKSEASSSWSSDQVMDFKKADFWQVEGKEQIHGATSVTLGNPFAPQLVPFPPPLPSPQNNPFVERPPDVLPAQAAILQVSSSEAPSLRDPWATPQALLFPAAAPEEPLALTPAPASILQGQQPLAFSTPSLQGVLQPSDFSFPSPVGGLAVAQAPLALSQPSTEPSAPSVLPAETWREEEAPVQWNASPHLVKPVSSTSGPSIAVREEEKEEKQRSASSSGSQEKLKPSMMGSLEDAATLNLLLGKTEAKRDPSGHAAQYYHLTHDELIQLLQKREAELGKERERVRELENYIDRLLVRIMEQSPTLLQISLGGEAKAAK